MIFFYANMEPDIEYIASSVIREYLSRKRCLETLEILDKELPRSPKSISNRLKLAQALQIEKWMKANKSHDKPFKTMLEVIIWNILMIKQKPNDSHNSFCDDHTSSGSNVEKSLSALQSQHSQESVVELVDLDSIDLNTNAAETNPNTKQSSVLQIDQIENMNPQSLQKQISAPQTAFSIENQRKSIPKKKATSVFEMLSASPEKVINARKSDQVENKAAIQFPWDAPRKNAKNSWATSNHNKTDVDTYSGKSLVKNDATPEMQKLKLDLGCKEDLNIVYDYETVAAVRNLVIGNLKSSYSPEWLNQSFAFCDCSDGRPNLLRFGIVQHKGGPCGVLAAIQATVLKHILFNGHQDINGEEILNVSGSFRSLCLANAIAEIVWRASGPTVACLILPTLYSKLNLPAGYRPDGFSENLCIQCHDSQSSLLESVTTNIQAFEKGKGSCLLLLYSVILSRGIEMVRRDMDDPRGKLMGAHNYCTQEMINLLLTGYATSNAFDHCIHLEGSTYLKGVQGKSDIGMLSLFEHYGSCEIGKFYKNPSYPIWVICSESHFSVMFSLNAGLVNHKIFDLYYYDGLANQDEIIRLTIDLSRHIKKVEHNEDLIPPLQHCIHTKWPNSSVDWNNTEPIL